MSGGGSENAASITWRETESWCSKMVSIARRVASLPLLAAMSEHHPLATKPALRLADLKGEHFVGAPDEEMGERMVGVAQAAPDVATCPELERELIDYARERMAHYKVPREMHFVDELPRTPTGKLVKGRLRAQFAGT